MVHLELKEKQVATTKVMVCAFEWKQNIGYLGKRVVVMGVHGHYHTMKMNFSNTDYEKWWDRINNCIDVHKVNFLVGDFNMSLTQVVPQLRKRGLAIDTCSWYPWLHMDNNEGGYCLGIDSCAIFYIGGNVECEMPWNPCQGPQSRQLHAYSGDNHLGKLWSCYKSKKDEKAQGRRALGGHTTSVGQIGIGAGPTGMGNAPRNGGDEPATNAAATLWV